MEMSATANEIDELLNGPLISWLESCLPHPEILTGFSSLLDGSILHSVWLQIDPDPPNHPLKVPPNIDGVTLANWRARNFDAITRNLRALYEEELGQTVLVLPDCSILGQMPESKVGLEQMRLILTLLLGAAVQCPNKKIFIGRIKELDVAIQVGIVGLIKQVTDNQSIVLTHESIKHLPNDLMYNHIIRLAKERDQYHSKWIGSIANESDTSNSSKFQLANDVSSPSSMTSSSSSPSAATEKNHLAVELADMKSKLRKLRQELEEKSESFMETKEELDHKISQYEKLRIESQEWYAESRRSAAYRDEVDVLRERADRADRLEVEVQRFREKLTDAEFYKTRVEELREDNRMLLETKEMLEEQLQRSRKRSEHAMTLESEIIRYKQKLNDLALERAADKNKLQELLEENTQLQITTKNLSISSEINRSFSDLEDDCASGENSLSEQFAHNTQSRVLKLELENRRLQQALDAMKESTFHESANKMLDLEKEKKKLSLKVEQQQETYNRMLQQNKELEDVFQNALEENQKLQDTIDARQQSNERQSQEREVDRVKIIDLEKHVETLTKEKQRIHTLNESIQRRADDLERLGEARTKEMEVLKTKEKGLDEMRNEVYELTTKLTSLEKENNNLTKDVTKLRETLEIKDVQLDSKNAQIETQTQTLDELKGQISEATVATAHYQEVEKRNQELLSQTKIDTETIATLQKDLIDGELTHKRVQQGLEKLGLDDTALDDFELNVEHVVKKLVKNPETFKTVREIMLNVGRESMTTTTSSADICVLCHKKEIFTVEKEIELSNNDNSEQRANEIHQQQFVIQFKEHNEQILAENDVLRHTNEQLQAENARQKVDLSTLASQISSLNTQHVALQLANSQLAAEKDVLVKQIGSVKQQHDLVLHDQVALQRLHEQLSAEYEQLCSEKELLKSTLRDLRSENRDHKEHEIVLEKRAAEYGAEMETIKKDVGNLMNLRAEHSNLKDDFRNLFTTSERLKNEYKNIQEQYKNIRKENGRLKLQNTELFGDMNSRVEELKSMEIELAKETQKVKMLFQINAELSTDRRSLMDHSSHLLTQYHELLAHSLEDKQHYYDEEKKFTDKVNNLHRQKEKLEEKIMEHYRKLDSCSPKKKPFGSGFVKRVKKASSELMNRSRPNRNSWIDDSRLSQSQFTVGSESGGNDSDNSNEEPISVASDTTLLQRNAHLRQSLQLLSDRSDSVSLSRGGVRGSLQSQHEDGNKSHRGSVHGLEPPDVTGTSLALGTAGSRRTVYLIDDDQKIPDTSEEANTPPAPPSETPTPTNQHAGGDTNPSTFLVYNRISTMIGGSAGDSPPGTNCNTSVVLNNSNSANGTQSNGEKMSANNRDKDKKRGDERGKESAIWYEYGCV